MSEALLEWLVQTPPSPPDDSFAYGAHEAQRVDLFRPEGESRATLLALHGGFWRARYDRQHLSHACRAWAQRGFSVANVEYRRVGHEGGGFPGTFDDVRTAARALVQRGAARLVLFGHSAGGHLALWLAAEHASWLGAAALGGVVVAAPVADLRRGHEQGLGSGAIGALLGRIDEAKLLRTSPAERLPLGVRQRLVHGTLDDQVPIAGSERYRYFARYEGDDIELRRLEGACHYAPVHPHTAAFAEVTQLLEALSE